jgi:opacity protein-like surface antigen
VRIGYGLGIGYLNAEAKLKDDFRAVDGGLADFKQTKKVVQLAPSLEVGLACFDNYYLGILANWNYIGAKTTSRASLVGNYYLTHQFKMKFSVNVLSKIGYKLSPCTMIYGLIGPSFLKWSHKTDQFYRPRFMNNLVDTFNISNTSSGLSLGLGIEYFMFDHVALNVDYSHNYYKSKSLSKTMSVIVYQRFPLPNTTQSGIVSKQVKPSYDSIMIRLLLFSS